MPHLANCHRLQTQIPLYTAHLEPVPSPLVRAGKIAICANLRSSQITLSKIGQKPKSPKRVKVSWTLDEHASVVSPSKKES